MDLSYILNHLGENRGDYADAVVPPIAQTTMFAHRTVAAMRERVADEYAHAVYTRGTNPTTRILRRKLAALEGSEDALVLGSGAAAVAAAVLASVRAGDHVVMVEKPYAWTRNLARQWLPRFGVGVTFVDAREVAAVESALTPATRAIVLESPNSMTFEQQDLGAIAARAKARGIRTIADNSYATPLGQSPLAFGIDVVVHSASKYLSGHSDVLAGAICASEEVCREIFAGPYMTFGALLAPHDAWLVLRGLRTLEVRMARVAETTATLVAWLERHPKVRRLHYPQSESYPQRALTAAQLRHANGLFSIELDTDLDGVERFCDGLERFLMSASWGGHESLVFPVAGVRDWRGHESRASVPVTLVRISIGLEDADVLRADLERAFARL